MAVLLDILGAIVIGGLLILMLVTFQYQLTDNAERQMFTRQLATHMENATTQLNYVMGMAGLGMDDPNSVVTHADERFFQFQTMWDYEDYQVGGISSVFPKTLSVGLHEQAGGEAGDRAILVRDITDPGHPEVLEDMGYVFWVDEVSFKYYDAEGTLLAEPVNLAAIRSVEMQIGFRRSAPRMDGRDLTSRVQIRCYLMNMYLQDS